MLKNKNKNQHSKEADRCLRFWNNVALHIRRQNADRPNLFSRTVRVLNLYELNRIFYTGRLKNKNKKLVVRIP